MLIWIETQLRQAIRDAVNRSSRKPFTWGGLRGYEQLEAAAKGLDQILGIHYESGYLLCLRSRVERVLAKNKTVAEDLKRAHEILLRVAQCLRYPPSVQGFQFEGQINGQWVAQEMTKLLEETRPSGRVQRAQIKLLGALKKRWELFGQELLYCYDIPGLPQDNLHLESLFGRLRRHQRRISGQKSTREINAFGQAQVLFTAKTPQDLLNQIKLVPYATYLVHRNRLADAELPRQFFHRLHRDPFTAISTLIQYHLIHSQGQKKQRALVPIRKHALHTQ